MAPVFSSLPIFQNCLIMLQNQSNTLSQAASIAIAKTKTSAKKVARKRRGPITKRIRKSVQSVHRELGPRLFRRAYRMSYPCFTRLAGKLSSLIVRNVRRIQMNDDLDSNSDNDGEDEDGEAFSSHVRHIHNGPIHPSVRLACAIRYFAGGSMLDLITVYGVSLSAIETSIKAVVQSVNDHPDFSISFPTNHDTQRKIADDFKSKSEASFDCCVGAIDGILIWTHKPTEMDCEEAKCDQGKFLCGRKHKFGLNMQAICDARGRFLDLSIMFPASTSDCLAFESSDLYKQLLDGILAEGLCLFGDNAYINSPFMATPFPKVGTGQEVTNVRKDAYNFYFSQLRIRIECAFGIFVHRWAILRGIFPVNTPMKRVVSSVVAMAKLHNYLIDCDEDVPDQTATDAFESEMNGGVPLVTMPDAPEEAIGTPAQLNGVGHHLDDVTPARRRQTVRRFQRMAEVLPRSQMFNDVTERNLTRPLRPLRSQVRQQ